MFVGTLHDRVAVWVSGRLCQWRNENGGDGVDTQEKFTTYLKVSTLGVKYNQNGRTKMNCSGRAPGH